jgi:hypothetical protein
MLLQSLINFYACFSASTHDKYNSGSSKLGKSKANTFFEFLDISTRYTPLSIVWKFLYKTYLV